MQFRRVLSAAVLLLARQAAGISLSAFQTNSTANLPGTVSVVVPAGTSVVPGATPPADGSNSKTFMASVMDWLMGTPKFTVRKVNDTITASAVNYVNVHKKAPVVGPCIEFQRSVPLYHDDQEYSTVHFQFPATNPAESMPIKGAKIHVRLVSNGSDVGSECPSKKIKVQRINTPDPEGKTTPVKIGSPVEFEARDKQVTAEIGAMFADVTNVNDLKDFWVVFEADTMCYFSIDAANNGCFITFDVEKSVKEEVVSMKRSTIGPIAILSLIVIGGAALYYRNTRTDYTYFQDQGDMIVNT
uniref:Uncharacterized protein n=1 Tax=Babesia bovis TaxID=5865 RepID=S6C742_BABBO|nr:hypothetical protein [Babesia bovis]